MKTMFISKGLHQTSGAGVGVRMHLSSLEKLVGKENVFIIDLLPNGEIIQKDNYMAFEKYRNALERLYRLSQGNIYLFSNKIIRSICNIIKENDIKFIFIDDSYYGNLVKKIKKSIPEAIVVCFFHDVKADLFPKWIRREKKIIRKIDYYLSIHQEKKSVIWTDANIVLNHTDDDFLKIYYGKKSDFYFPVCIKEESINAKTPYKENGKLHILFVGTGYYPNKAGMKWFYDNVFINISHICDLTIVGKGLETLRDDIKDNGVEIIGYADSLIPFYQYADIVVAPLTDGGGMKIKTAEAFAYGKCFLGTSESLRGYYENIPNEVLNNHIFCCDSPEEYILAIQKIEKNGISKCNSLVKEIYKQYYSEEAAVRYMKNIIDSTIINKKSEK